MLRAWECKVSETLKPWTSIDLGLKGSCYFQGFRCFVVVLSDCASFTAVFSLDSHRSRWHARHCVEDLHLQVLHLRASHDRSRAAVRVLSQLQLLPFLRAGQRGEVADCIAAW